MSQRLSVARGVAMVELLIAMLVIAFGVLGFVGMQAQTTLSQVEGLQRNQALLMVEDIGERMSLNRVNAASYVGNNIGINFPSDCAAPATQAAKDLCEWSALLQGASEIKGSVKVGAMLGARGCIATYADPADPSGVNYIVTVAWQGVVATGAPAAVCGSNQYSNESLRRTVNKVIRFATLG